MIYKPKGKLVVNIIFKVKEDLMDIFKKMKEGDVLKIDLSSLSKIDITFIQILYSANKYAKNKDFIIKIQNPSNEVLNSLIHGGFLKDIRNVDNLDLGSSLINF